MWKEVIEVFSAVLVSMGGLELVKWLANRKSNSRTVSAEASKAETSAKTDDFQLLKELIVFTQSQMTQMQEWLRREQAEHAADIEKCRALQEKYDTLKREYDDLQRKYNGLMADNKK